MKLQFFGAARTVTGSCHLVEIGRKRILLDCGLFQGRRKQSFERNRRQPFEPGSIDSVVLSHAHIDHSGNLPTTRGGGVQGQDLQYIRDPRPVRMDAARLGVHPGEGRRVRQPPASEEGAEAVRAALHAGGCDCALSITSARCPTTRSARSSPGSRCGFRTRDTCWGRRRFTSTGRKADATGLWCSPGTSAVATVRSSATLCRPGKPTS